MKIKIRKEERTLGNENIAKTMLIKCNKFGKVE